jgi:hypothetical protein
LILSAFVLLCAGAEREREREGERKSWKFVLDVFLSLFSSTVVAVIPAAATKPVSEVQQLAACQSEAQKACYRPSPCNQTWNTLPTALEMSWVTSVNTSS